MSLLPIVERELRTAARQGFTYWMRCVTALSALGFLLVSILSASHSSELDGQLIFRGVAIVTFILAVFAGVFLTSDVLSSEKRQDTLGLLFLTDLHGYDVVLGKFISSSIHALYAVIAVIPILSIPFLIGGVTLGEFLRVTVALLLSILFSLNLGLLVSAVGYEVRNVALASFTLVLTICGLFPGGCYLILDTWNLRHFDLFVLPTPTGTFFLAFSRTYNVRFWISAVLVFGISALFLVLACYRAEIAWREARPSKLRRVNWKRLTLWLQKLSKRFTSQRTRVENDPFVWLGSRVAISRLFGWLAVVLMLPLLSVVALGTLFKFVGRSGGDALLLAGVVLGSLGHVLFKYVICYQSCRHLSEDRLSGALESLLTSPVDEKSILRGLRIAAAREFKSQMVCLLTINLILFGLTTFGWEQLDFDTDARLLFQMFFGGGMLMLLLDFWGITWVGQWRGLMAKNTNRALAGVIGLTLIPGWVSFGIVLLILTIGPGSNQNGVLATCIGFALIVPLITGGYARSRVARGIRWALEKG